MFVIILGTFDNQEFNTLKSKEEIDNIVNLFKNTFQHKLYFEQCKIFKKDKLKYKIDNKGNHQLIQEEIKNLNIGNNFICFDKKTFNLPIYHFENYYEFDTMEVIETNIMYTQDFKFIVSSISTNEEFNQFHNELRFEFKNFTIEHLNFLKDLNIDIESKQLIQKEIEYFVI